MHKTLDKIRNILRNSDLGDSLLFLSHLLAVLRGEAQDPLLKRRFARLRTRPPEFVVHFIAKWLVLEASEFGLYTLDWDRYKRLQDLYFELNDPIVGDPTWKNAEPTGFFERILSLQLPTQRPTTTRDFGLMLVHGRGISRVFRAIGSIWAIICARDVLSGIFRESPP
jgi:hypothetical protein